MTIGEISKERERNRKVNKKEKNEEVLKKLANWNRDKYMYGGVK